VSLQSLNVIIICVSYMVKVSNVFITCNVENSNVCMSFQMCKMMTVSFQKWKLTLYGLFNMLKIDTAYVTSNVGC